MPTIAIFIFLSAIKRKNSKTFYICKINVSYDILAILMIEELKRFLLVAKEGNITRTAEKIYITQSALTQSIHRLEKELHTKLFLQKGKQLRLTEEGSSLVIIGEKIMQLWTTAHDPAIRNSQIQTYAIGMFDNIALRLGKFLQSNLQSETYKLELTIDSSGKLLKQLQLGTLDAALCIINKKNTLPKHLMLLQSFTEELIPVSSKSFSKEIANIPFILYNRGSQTRGQIDELFISHGLQPSIYAESTSVTFMRELALLGAGVALLPENFIQQDLDQGRLKKQKMPIQWQRNFALLINTNSRLSAAHPVITSLKHAMQNL
jgi:DNA-binding transcriptional LysR family regulator